MARLARVVIPGVPHHVTQRGNRRETVFFSDDDYRAYLGLLAEQAQAAGTAIWAYCLLPNHCHVIAVPADEDGLRKAFADANRRYARRINAREGWRGHLWQERYGSFALDEAHLWAAARYVELNPVRAGLTARADDWPWSSARAHLAGADDAVVTVAPLLQTVGDWATYLGEPTAPETGDLLRRHEQTGRPLGNDAFMAQLEELTGRRLRKLRPGPHRGEAER